MYYLKKCKLKPARNYKTEPEDFKDYYRQVSEAFREAKLNSSTH
jgi:hypothetical protein